MSLSPAESAEFEAIYFDSQSESEYVPLPITALAKRYQTVKHFLWWRIITSDYLRGNLYQIFNWWGLNDLPDYVYDIYGPLFQPSDPDLSPDSSQLYEFDFRTRKLYKIYESAAESVVESAVDKSKLKIVKVIETRGEVLSGL